MRSRLGGGVPAWALAGLTALAVLVPGCGGGAGERPSEPVGGDPRAPAKAIWGPVTLPSGGSAFSTYDELGVEVFQIQLRWERVATRRPESPRDPDDPAYNWPADLERALREGEDRGIEVAVLVTGSPGWANGGRDWMFAPRDEADYADFLVAAASRYPEVRIWMVWGEPNRDDRFRPAGPEAAPRYARLLDAAYEALKSVSADKVIVGGMTFSGGDPAGFVRGLRLESGRPPRLDWYGHNPYPFRFPDLSQGPVRGGYRDLSDLDTLSREVRSHFGQVADQPPLWLSEFTIQSDGPSEAFAADVTREEQAEWLRAGYRAARQSEVVAGLGWFTLVDQAEGAGGAGWGLMTDDEDRKPSFYAYRDLEMAGG